MSNMPGRIVITRDTQYPYKVVLNRPCDGRTEFPVASVREGEQLIRQKVPSDPPMEKQRIPPRLPDA
jgi:hypothetical protein